MNTVFIFEDNQDSVLSQFYTFAFKDEESKASIVYANGNGELLSTARHYVDDLHYDLVIIFMDLVPGNTVLKKIYSQLARLSKRREYKIIVMPVVSSEYLFIRSLDVIGEKINLDLLNRNKDTYNLIDKLIKKLPYYDVDFVRNSENFKNYFKTLEKLSKYILRVYVAKCVTTKIDEDTHGCNYYTCDCINGNICGATNGISVLEKSKCYVKQFPCFPCLDSDSKSLTTDELWALHRKLIDDFNEVNIVHKRQTELLCNSGISDSNISKVKYISTKLDYIKE